MKQTRQKPCKIENELANIITMIDFHDMERHHDQKIKTRFSVGNTTVEMLCDINELDSIFSNICQTSGQSDFSEDPIALFVLRCPQHSHRFLLASPYNMTLVQISLKNELFFARRDLTMGCRSGGRIQHYEDDAYETEEESAWIDLLRMMIDQELQFALSHACGLIFVHAGCVASGQRGVLLCGPTHSGKTTLSTALALKGYDFLTDDTTCLVFKDGTLLPYPSRFRLRNGGRLLLGQMLSNRQLLQTSVDLIKGAAFKEKNDTIKPKILFFLDGFAKSPFAHPIMGAEVLRRLGAHLICTPSLSPSRLFSQLGMYLNGVLSYSIVLGGYPETVDLIDSLVTEKNGVAL